MLQDIRYAVRGLVRNPGFTAIAVLTLALGFGVNSVMFGLVDAVLFRPLPVPQPERLVRIGMTEQSITEFGGLSYPLVKDLQTQADALAGVAAFSSGNTINLSIGDQQAERVTAATITGNFFSVLGVQPALGRLIGPEDDSTPGGHPVLVLSDGYWRRRFGANPNVIGSAVRMNTHAFTIIGVAPRGFHGATLEEVPDVWIPVTMVVHVNPNMAQFKPLERRGITWLDTLGRLAPGVSAAQATAQLEVINARVNLEQKIDTSGDRYTHLLAVPLADVAVSLDRRDRVQQTSWMLMGVTALVLLIACAVAAGLLLVRAEHRRREVALRFALGASRARVVRQLLTESALLAGGAAALGLVLAAWSTDLILAIAPEAFPLPIGATTSPLASRALWFTGGLAILCTFAFGLMLAWRVSPTRLVETITRESPLEGGRHRWWSLSHAFVVTQVALSAVLLVGAGLLLRTLDHATRVDLGFDPQHGLVMALDVSKSGYDRARGRQLYADLLERVRQIPGVESAAISRHVPVQSAGMITSIALTNFTPPQGEEPRVSFTPVSPDFFRTIGIPLERGRDFSAADENGPSRVIVNRAFADRFWPGRDPLSERVLNFGEKGAEVIGIAGDAKLLSIREEPTPMIYVPDSAFYVPSTNVVIRTAGEPRAMLPAVTAVVRTLDRNVPIFRINTLTGHIGQALGQERMLAGLLSGFAALALLLAAIGLYGVISYTTHLRTREFGIRLALGAVPADLQRRVLGQGAGLAGVGLLIGLAIAVGVSRVMATLLFGVTTTDRLTFAVMAAVLLVVAVAASAIPARRAARVDPMVTLRYE